MYWALLLVYLQQYCYCSVFSIALVIRWVIKKQEKYPVAVLAGIVYAAMLGFALFPFKAVQVLVLGSLSTVSNGLTADFASFTVLTFIVTAVCLAIYMLIMKFVIRPDISNFEGVGDMFEDLRHIKMTGEQKLRHSFLCLFMFAMFAPSVLPKEFFVTKFFTALGITGSLVFVLVLMAMLKIKGKVSFNFSECAKDGMNWDMIIMFVATMPVSAAMSSEDVGVIDFLVELLSPIFTQFSGLAFCAVFLIIAGLLTQVAHNLVLAALMTPILYQFLHQAGRRSCNDVRAVFLCSGYFCGNAGRFCDSGPDVYQRLDWQGQFL